MEFKIVEKFSNYYFEAMLMKKVNNGKAKWKAIKNLSIKSILLYLFFHEVNPIAVTRTVEIRVIEEPKIKSTFL